MRIIFIILFCFTLLYAQTDTRPERIKQLQQRADSLEKVIDSSDNQPSAEQYLNLSQIYRRLGLMARSFAYLLKAQDLATSSTDYRLRLQIVQQQAQLYLTTGQSQKALDVLHESLRIPDIKKDAESYLSILSSIFFSEINLNSMNSKALYAGKKYLDEAVKLQKFEHQVMAAYNIAANIYHTQGTPEAHAAAIKYYEGVLEIISKHSEAINPQVNFQSRNDCYNNIGDIYEREKNYDKALEFYLKSLSMWEGKLQEFPSSGATVLVSVSTIYNIKGQFEAARTHLEQALQINNSNRNPRNQLILKGMIYDQLNIAFQGLGQSSLAAEYLKKSEDIKDSLIVLDSSMKDSSRVITSLETGNIIGKIEAEKERLKQREQLKSLQLEKAKASRNYLLGGLIFAILASLLILSRYRVKAIANRNITTISKIGQDITSVLEFEDLLYTFYEDSNKLMEVDAFGLGLLNEGKVRFRFFINNNERLPEFTDEPDDNISPALKCLLKRQDLLINDLDNQPEFKTYFNRIMPASKLRSALYLPLISKDKVLGVLAVLCNKRNGYVDQHLNMLKTLASYLTIALDNSRVYSELNTLNSDLKVSNDLIKAEQEKADRLLLNILPAKIATELKEKGNVQPEVFKNVTVMFTDLVDFTRISAGLSPQEVINELNDLFSNFDRIVSANGCLRIKTIGDAYLAVSGMPEPDEKHTEKLFKAAVEIVDYLTERNKSHDIQWLTRIGLHTGEVVGGIIGVEKYIYDIFGDTVNVAFRMEQLSRAMQINVTAEVYSELKDHYAFNKREGLQVKGREGLEVWWWGRG